MPPVVVFDLFGTLLDIGSIASAAAAHVRDAGTFVQAWRDKQIAYAFATTLMGGFAGFDAVTEAALRYTLARFGVALDDEQTRSLTSAWTRLRAYDDALPLLERLRADNVRAVVLTNGTHASADAALANAGLAHRIERVLSVEDVRAYKPDPRVYAHAVAALGVAARDIVFISSNGWDATGAQTFGFRVAWCNRAGLPPETLGPPPEWTIRSLTEVASLVARAAR